MGRRGVPRPGMAVPGLGVVLLVGALTTGCGGPGGPGSTHGSGGPANTRRASASAPARPASHAELCARIVAHWSRNVLDSDTYGDYQSMGLSNGQYEILRDVVDSARAVKQRQGAAAADELIVRRAHRACADRYRHGTPSGGPWQ